MATVNKYRVYCTTDSKYEYTWSETEPTTCPTNTAHSIDASKTTIVDQVDPNIMTIKEETTPTSSKFQVTSILIDASGSTTTTVNHSFLYPISVLSSYMVTASDHEGDKLTVNVAPNTTVGTLTIDASTNVNVFDVGQTVIDNTIVGNKFRLTDGTNTDELGWVTAIDTVNKKVTTENSTTNSFSAATPTSTQVTAVFSDDIEFGPAWEYSFGASKIGGAYVPANIVCEFKYTNNTASAKKLRIFLEYLY